MTKEHRTADELVWMFHEKLAGQPRILLWLRSIPQSCTEWMRAARTIQLWLNVQ
jgi:hypothetical protein